MAESAPSMPDEEEPVGPVDFDVLDRIEGFWD
jgi:hypothetical protein